MDNPADRIVPLDQLEDFRIAEGDPDVRGWDVLSSDGRRIGEVDDLLVDIDAMKVRYLDVEMDPELIDGDRTRHILIPIGYARLDRSQDQVRVDALDSTRLSMIPDYDNQPLTGEYESRLHSHFRGAGGGREGPEIIEEDVSTASRFYGRGTEESRSKEREKERGVGEERHLTLSEEELDVGRREHRSGEVTVGKKVETEHVHERVPLRHEEVTIEHRPAEGMRGSARIGEEEEIRVPISEEELTVDKRVVPKEEIVVRKQERIDTQDVDADLRRERVDIRREGEFEMRERNLGETGERNLGETRERDLGEKRDRNLDRDS